MTPDARKAMAAIEGRMVATEESLANATRMIDALLQDVALGNIEHPADLKEFRASWQSLQQRLRGCGGEIDNLMAVLRNQQRALIGELPGEARGMTQEILREMEASVMEIHRLFQNAEKALATVKP